MRRCWIYILFLALVSCSSGDACLRDLKFSLKAEIYRMVFDSSIEQFVPEKYPIIVDLHGVGVDSLIYDPGNGEFVGKIGERLELYAYLYGVYDLDSNYGTSWLHCFRDDLGNEYTWTTSSKRLEDDKEYHFKGTIKEHKTYRNRKQNVLTRCTIL